MGHLVNLLLAHSELSPFLAIRSFEGIMFEGFKPGIFFYHCAWAFVRDQNCDL